MKQQQRDLRIGLAYVSPWLMGFVLLTLYPFLASLYWSLCRYDLLTDPVWIGAEHYQRLWQELLSGREFGEALWNTLYYAAVVVPGSVVLGVLLAVLLNAGMRGQAMYRTLFFLPAIVPAVATSLVWMWLLDPKRGPVNHVLGFVGLEPSWFNSPSEFFNPAGWVAGIAALGSKDALALMSLWGIGNFIIIYLAALQKIPAELYEAAELEGATPWQQFRHVTLPQLTPVIFFNMVMGLIAAVQYFTQAYIVSGGTGGPAGSTRVLSLHIFLWGFKYQEAGYASAVAWTLFLLVMLITYLLFKSSRGWVHYS